MISTAREPLKSLRAMVCGWSDSANLAALKAATAATGAFPLKANSADTALLLTLPPGTYTLQVGGRERTTGIALIELYAVP